jgi:hypothetical protein
MEDDMVMKRVSPVKKTAKRRTAPKMTEAAVIVSTGIDPEVRRQLVAAEAYFLAERRGFAAGNELQDWVIAEAAVDSRLQHSKVA